MSKNKATKLKKQRKPMSPEAKRNLGNVFKSLVSNQACVDGGRDAPWWIAVIFLVLSLCLPVIPITVNLSKAYGSSFLASASYGTDRGLALTSQAYSEDGYDFILNDDGLLHFYKDTKELEPSFDNLSKDDIYVNTATSEQYYNFRLFITNKTAQPLTDFVNALANAKFKKGTIEEFVDPVTDENKNQYYTPSFIVLAPDTLVMAVYKNQSADKASSTASGLTWKNTEKGNLLLRLLKTKTESVTESDKINDIYENWKGVFNETYLEAKNRQTLNTTLLYLGVYAGLILFLGLMIFLLTRGKSNPFNYLNFFVCQKITWWASFTPAVLGMILSFIMGTNMIGQMSFIVLVSLRVMWLSMRQLRPMQ